MSISSDILREYDIRGTYGKNLFPATAFAIGQKFGQYVKNKNKKTVAVAYDGRLSSPELVKALIEGLIKVGIDVINVGLGPTPLLYFAVYHLKLDAGIMVTGSHNPKDDNGFKMLLSDHPVYGKDIKSLPTLEIMEENGSLNYQDIKKDYINRLLSAYKPEKKIKFAIDVGNGAAGEIVEALAENMRAQVYLLNSKIDGHFPAHHPDPTDPKNLRQLIDCVKQGNLDAGFAFDGDADRIGLVSSTGQIVWGDQLLLLLGQDILKKHVHPTFIGDVKVSQSVFDVLTNMGANMIMSKTGHSLIKVKMLESKALLAGEMSGHIFIADDYYGFDDGLFAMIRILNILQQENFCLNQFLAHLPPVVNTPEIRIPCIEQQKLQVIQNVRKKLIDQKEQFDETDGVRVLRKEGWWLLRASNTESILVARIEGRTQEDLEALKKHFTFLTGYTIQ